MLTWRRLLLRRDAFLDLPGAIERQRGALAVCRGGKHQAGDQKAACAESARIVAPQGPRAEGGEAAEGAGRLSRVRRQRAEAGGQRC